MIDTKRLKGNDGMIAIVTLWVLAILSVIAIGLGYRVGIDLKIARFHLDDLRVLYAAKSGIYRAAAEILYDQSTNRFDHLAETWNGDDDTFRDVPLDGGGFRVGYRSTGSRDGLGEEWTFGIIDEERKINIHKVSEDMLDRLQTLGLSASFLLQIREELPETEFYSMNEYEKFAPAVSVTLPELLRYFPFDLLSGDTFDSQDLDMAAKYLTIYGDGKVNVNTAGREVLEIIGMPGSLTERILSYRAGADGIEGTDDDTPFSQLDSIPQKLSEFGELSPTEKAELSYLIKTETITVESRFFSVHSAGFLDGNSATRHIAAVLERTAEEGVVIHYWYES